MGWAPGWGGIGAGGGGGDAGGSGGAWRSGAGGSPPPPPFVGVYDDFSNRRLPDDVPTYFGGSAGGLWGTASCGVAWDGGGSPSSRLPGDGNLFVGVSGGVGLGVGQITLDPNRIPLQSPSSPTFTNGTLNNVPSPLVDEPTFSFRVRTSFIPDGTPGLFFGTRGPTVLYFGWSASDGVQPLNVGLVISSAVGSIGLGIPSFDGGGNNPGIAKLDWLADTWYTVLSQYLHDGTIRMRIVPDGGPDPGWQVVNPTGLDYGDWGGGGYWLFAYTTDDDASDDPGDFDHGDVIVTSIAQLQAL